MFNKINLTIVIIIYFFLILTAKAYENKSNTIFNGNDMHSNRWCLDHGQFHSYPFFIHDGTWNMLPSNSCKIDSEIYSIYADQWSFRKQMHLTFNSAKDIVTLNTPKVNEMRHNNYFICSGSPLSSHRTK